MATTASSDVAACSAEVVARLAPSAALRRAVEGRLVVVTGSSEGIGARLAQRLAAAGGRLILIARGEEKLAAVRERILAEGGEAHLYIANLSCEKDCDRVLAEVLADFGHVDIFVSNAGRSIRRSVKFQGGQRFHDFQRLMALNYFGALHLILGVLPGMQEQGFGQVVHVSSFGVPTRQPRFAGYCASKAALDAALQSAAGEVAANGVTMSTVYMPLVQTRMVQSRGFSYDHFSMLTVDVACEYIEHAIISRRAEIMDAPTRWLSFMHMLRPGLVNMLNSLVYRLESEKAPDDVVVSLPEKASSRKLKTRSKGGNKTLKVLANLMWFFSRLEMLLCMKLGMPWLMRDLIAMVVLAVVLIVQPFVGAAISAIRTATRVAHALTGGSAPPEEVRCSGVDEAKAQQLDVSDETSSTSRPATSVTGGADVDELDQAWVAQPLPLRSRSAKLVRCVSPPSGRLGTKSRNLRRSASKPFLTPRRSYIALLRPGSLRKISMTAELA